METKTTAKTTTPKEGAKKRRRTKASANRVVLCHVTGLRGGSTPLTVVPSTGALEIGVRSFPPEELRFHVKTKRERRLARRALFRFGFRALAQRTLGS